MRLLIALLVVSVGCRKSPEANPEFDDAARFVLISFDNEPEVLAFALRQIERQVYLSLDVEDGGIVARAVELSPITEADVADIDRPDRDLTLASPVALAGLSVYGSEHHQLVQFLEDQTPVEPYSPDVYDRRFEVGDDCWQDQACERMETYNVLVKESALYSIPYEFHKHFRWVDMNLPDPADVPVGELAVNDGDPRWAFVARSWTSDSYESANGRHALNQSYTIDMWIPRDGQGFSRTADDVNQDDGEWTTDSNGGGSLRLLALWHETIVGGALQDGDLATAFTRNGIQDNFDAADDYIRDTYFSE
jgi:hypothetical protein